MGTTKRAGTTHAFRPSPFETRADMDEDYSKATCDQCGPATRARYVIAMPSGRVLSYCGSHTRQHWTPLNELGALIVELSPA